MKKWPKKSQWAQIFNILTKKEKIVFLFLLIIFLGSGLFLFLNFYYRNTVAKPAPGGVFTEGIVGQPRFINPIYANSDADRDITQLIYPSLMKFDGNLNIIPELARDYKIEENGTVYRFFLKDNAKWEDGQLITADDVIFTIKTIQSPEYKSPFRANWVGVEVEKVSGQEVLFDIKRPYSSFLESATIKILPKHIWENISPENFALNSYNLKPVGGGPYKLKQIDQDGPASIKSVMLSQNPYYFSQRPNISELKFLFFDDEKELAKRANLGGINGFSLSSSNTNPMFNVYQIFLPRYFAVFFNLKQSKIFTDSNVRSAINYATDKNSLAKQITGILNNNIVVDSPVLDSFYGLDPSKNSLGFDLEKAKNILDKDGFVVNGNGFLEKTLTKVPAFRFTRDLGINSKGTEVEQLQKCLAKFPDIYPDGTVSGSFGPKTKDAVIKFQEKYRKDILDPSGYTQGTGQVKKSTRDKLNEVCFGNPQETLPLEFTLNTVDQPQLVKMANILKDQWKALGANVNIQALPLSQLEQDVIKTRNYEALLLGESLGSQPDLLPFWHSSQEKDPGLNLTQFENSKADSLLEEIRTDLDQNDRKTKLESLQDIILDSSPAVFLINPPYLYYISKNVKGVDLNKITDPSKRFTDIENWYIKTRRAWK